MATSSTPSSPAPSAMAAMAAAVFSSPSSPAAQPPATQTPRKGYPRRTSAFNDSALLRIFAEKDPLNAPHGTKGAVWDDVGVALAQEPGEERAWTGPACRTRVYSLLESYDIFLTGKKMPQTIRQLNKSSLQVLERTLKRIAKARVGGAATGDADREEASKSAPIVVPTPLKPKNSTTQATSSPLEPAAATKTTVVAKRRKRKGVKTKEQKRATAAMFEAMRHSREAYLNQLRVETAAQAAAEESGESPAKAKYSPDVDLSLLRAVVKFSPFEATEPTAVKAGWQEVSDRVFRHCGLRFPQTAIRDRCDALLEDFERNERKSTTYASGVAVADEERLKLLRMLYKAHKKRRRLSLDKPHHGVSDLNGAQSSLIEIDDESGTAGEQENAQIEEEEQEQIIDETEEDEEESKPESIPVSRKRPRRESLAGGASPDADPAAGMEFELEDEDTTNDNSRDSIESHDYTPRKHKQRRTANALVGGEAEGADTQLSAVLEAMKAERHERRFEFRSLLDLMKTQLNDSRSKCEREFVQRTREQDARQRESSALMEMLSQEREDRKIEVAALMTTISKERDDRRNEFMVMMNLVTKMIDSKSAAAPSQ